MNALDTNVLVRLLVRDDERQAQRALGLLQAAEGGGEPFFVADVVVLELIWVLRSAYSLPRTEILEALELLADLPILEFQSHDPVRQLVRVGRSTELDLADLFIGLRSRAAGCDATFTFEGRLHDSELFASVP